MAAHPGHSATALVKIDARGRFDLTLRVDALALALDEDPATLAHDARTELLHGPDDTLTRMLTEARESFATVFEVRADDQPIAFEIVAFPTTAEVRAWQQEARADQRVIKLDVLGQARLPDNTRSVSLRFPQVMGSVILTVDHPGAEPIAFPLRPGEWTPQIPVRVSPSGAGGPSEAQGKLAAPMSTLEVAARYVRLGFTHIVPHGLDHVLFVLGLFLLGTSLRALLLQVTAFTVAHSITLALTMLDVVELPPHVVEPVIAASIAFVAIENVATSRMHAWRPVIVFLFGLVHGMGFAGVLRELGLPRGQLATALVGFNVGVELGQLTVIACAFLAVGWWRKRTWYRKRIVIPASLLIAAFGLVWTVQRLL